MSRRKRYVTSFRPASRLLLQELILDALTCLWCPLVHLLGEAEDGDAGDVVAADLRGIRLELLVGEVHLAQRLEDAVEVDVAHAEVEVLVQSRGLADFFEAAAKLSDARKAANFVLGPLLRECHARGLSVADPAQWAMKPEALAELARIVDQGLISAKIASDIFGDIFESGTMPEAYVKEKGLVQISDTSAIEQAVDAVIAANPSEVEAFKGGKTKLISFFVGQIMRATKGKANPALVNELLAKKL